MKKVFLILMVTLLYTSVLPKMGVENGRNAYGKRVLLP